MERDEKTPIQQFYARTHVFVTGGTGFLGKILIEKLLRSCPELDTIYLLIREKKGKTMEERLDHLLDNVIFDKLKEERPKFRHQIVGIKGDCALPDLGMSIEDICTLQNQVDVVFHVAATVRFDEHLKTAVDINVKATKYMLQLSKNMSKLKAFLHVSTAYSNCIREWVHEQFYEPPIDPNKLIVLSETLDKTLLDKITPSLLGKHPNTYAFTKAVAETVVRNESQSLPVAVFRPAIVISTYQEPLRGWIDNLYGPTGFTAAASTGLMRTAHVDKNANANLVPVDMCVNALIALSWQTHRNYLEARRQEQEASLKIYNYESSNDAPLNWDTYMKYTYEKGTPFPSIHVIWYFVLFLFANRYLFAISNFILHTIPAYIVDALLVCTGRTPRMVKVYEKLNKFGNVMAYFCTRTFKFDSHNLHAMLTKMTPEDRALFFCDLRQLNWADYFEDYFKGIRFYLIGDPEETLPEARAKYRRLYWIHQTLKTISIIALCQLFYTVIIGVIY